MTNNRYKGNKQSKMLKDKMNEKKKNYLIRKPKILTQDGIQNTTNLLIITGTEKMR